MREPKKDRVNKKGSITLNLGEHFGDYINTLLSVGRHINASEIVREALREYEDKRKKEIE